MCSQSDSRERQDLRSKAESGGFTNTNIITLCITDFNMFILQTNIIIIMLDIFQSLEHSLEASFQPEEGCAMHLKASL